MSKEAMKLALEAMMYADACLKKQLTTKDKHEYAQDLLLEAGAALKQALEQPEPEPVAWLITDEKINSIQVDSIQRLIDRAKHAHMTDIKLRINGQDEWYQADWLKHMTRTSPTKPEPVAWAISFDGETPYKLWDGGDCALLDIEVKRHGGKTRKMPLYTSPPETAELMREIAELSANALDDYKMIQSLMAEREPEQNPVAWRNAALRVGEDLCSVGPFGYYDMTAEQWLDWALSVVTVHAPPPKREPPCKTGSQCTTKCMECTEPEPVIDKSAAIRIATSLGWTPQREWVGLTDEQIWELSANCLDSVAGRLAFARAIEAKLKEKNT